MGLLDSAVEYNLCCRLVYLGKGASHFTTSDTWKSTLDGTLCDRVPNYILKRVKTKRSNRSNSTLEGR